MKPFVIAGALCLAGCAAPVEESDLPRGLGDEILIEEALDLDLFKSEAEESPRLELRVVLPDQSGPIDFPKEPDRGLYANPIPEPATRSR